MKKVIILFLCVGIFAIFVCGCNTTKEEKNNKINEKLIKWQNSYNYPGIFYFYADGGLNYYGYMNIQKEKLAIETLWNEDYSGISKEIGEKREKIKELSNDKKLIEESKNLYKANSDIEFMKINSNNLDKLEKIVEEYVTK